MEGRSRERTGRDDDGGRTSGMGGRGERESVFGRRRGSEWMGQDSRRERI